MTSSRGVTLNIEAFTLCAGEIAAIVGAVGSGKSDLLAILTGQARPQGGYVCVCGLDPVQERQKLSALVGVLFATNNLYERLSVRDNLRFHCHLRGLPATRCDEVLGEVGLSDHANTTAGKLPAALARRLAFGRALLHRPALLLLMEPFSGCETTSCTLITRLIRQYALAGTAVLILAREGTGMANLCQAVFSLEGGHLSRVGLPSSGQEARGGGDPQGMAMPFKVPARQEGQVILINPADILYASAEADQTCLHTPQGDVNSHLTMGELEERLVRNGFFRAHRSYLVNLQRVKAIIPYTRDSYTLILDDPAGTEIPLSKNAAKELRDLLGY